MQRDALFCDTNSLNREAGEFIFTTTICTSKRVQVEEGFLDGLDLHLDRGLNVVIGERGTGKTSLIELIRFCLDVPGYTPESSERSRDHAISVLGSG
jgi:AAA15 family ATPase/GTPase